MSDTRDYEDIAYEITKLTMKKKDAFGENLWKDICGYSLLGISNDEN